MSLPVPASKPSLSGNEKKYLMDCIDSGWISGEGPYVAAFEQGFSAFCDCKYGVAVSSGSGALDVALAALELQPGDEVIMPTFTIISPALSIIRAGAKPVLIDSDPTTWNMDVQQIRARITTKTRAVLVVHIYGLPVDMDPVIDLCLEYNLRLIEDAAEVHGQTYKGKKCGSLGAISTFSFYLNKNLTTGEGGMITTNDEKLAQRCRKLRNLAFETTGRRFVHYESGWNYRMTNLQAALGVAQLERIDDHIASRRALGEAYRHALGGLKGFQLPLHATDYADNIYWVFGLVADSEELCNRVIAGLSSAGIGVRPFFWCMHEQPVFLKSGLFKGERYPVAERISRNGLYLPNSITITMDEVHAVVTALRRIAS